MVYTFVRRPQYYAAFNSGRVLAKQQRFGLGLLWHPQMGAVLQSQTGTSEAAWGTRPSDAENVSEGATFQPVLKINGRQIEPKPGAFDLPDGERDRVRIRDEGPQDGRLC